MTELAALARMDAAPGRYDWAAAAAALGAIPPPDYEVNSQFLAGFAERAPHSYTRY